MEVGWSYSQSLFSCQRWQDAKAWLLVTFQHAPTPPAALKAAASKRRLPPAAFRQIYLSFDWHDTWRRYLGEDGDWSRSCLDNAVLNNQNTPPGASLPRHDD